jgi:hypothetical protein
MLIKINSGESYCEGNVQLTFVALARKNAKVKEAPTQQLSGFVWGSAFAPKIGTCWPLLP